MQRFSHFSIVGLIVLSCFGLINCQSKMITKDYDSAKKIQIVPLNETSALMVQNDHLLNEDSLFSGMAKESDAVAKPATDAQKFRRISNVAGNLQLITLFGCLFTTAVQPALMWCMSSIGFGVLGTIPFNEKAEVKKYEAAKQHNEALAPSATQHVTIH